MVKSRNANDAEKAVAVAEAKKGGEDTGATPQKKKSRKKNATAKGAGVEAKDEVDTKKAVETKKDENPVTEDSQTGNTQQQKTKKRKNATVEEGTVVVDNTEVVRANEKLNAGKTVEAKKDEEDMVTEGVQEGPKRKRRKRRMNQEHVLRVILLCQKVSAKIIRRLVNGTRREKNALESNLTSMMTKT